MGNLSSPEEFSHLQENFLTWASLPSLFTAAAGSSGGAGTGVGSGRSGCSRSEPLPPSRAFAMTTSASSLSQSSLNFNVTRSRGMSVCPTGRASALLLAAIFLPPRFV